jgi:flagellar assembly protein FliH
MLSKVLKGAEALQAQTMAFAAAIAPPVQARQPISPESTAGTDGQSVLLEKIRALEAARDATKREAWDSGHEQGELNARAVLAPVLERMNASIAEVVGMRRELRRRAEKDAVELSLQIARRVLHRELSIDINALNALARIVFDRLARSESWQLTVHPQFADSIRGALPAGSAESVRIDSDPSCAPGTVILRCGDGVIDASVDTQLAEISRGLTDRLTRK